MTHQSLEEALQAAESPVEMLRNSQTGPYAFPEPPSSRTGEMSSVPGERLAFSSNSLFT